MVAFGKLCRRLMIFLALVLGAIAFYKPPTVTAYQDCCQSCEDRLSACLSHCTTAVCRSSCDFQLRFCIEGCPACLSAN
jgi:hypothetical protein